MRANGAACLLLAASVWSGPGVRAEMVEDIVAWVNGDIITRSDFEAEREALIAEANRRHAGEELDREVRRIREALLLQMIDRKILVDHARRMFQSIEKIRDSLYQSFKEQQKIKSDEELARLLAQEGMTIDDLKRRLIEMYAPEEVISIEIENRIAVSDAEIARYHEANPAEFTIPAEVTLREIVLLAERQEARAARREEARAVRARLAAGEDFAEVAGGVSEAGTRDEGGLLGPLRRGELAPAIEELAFGLPVGELSDLLEMPYGFHILRVESRTEDRVRPLDEVRASLRRSLEEKKYRSELQAFMSKAREEAEWCVKPRYAELLSVSSPPCEPF